MPELMPELMSEPKAPSVPTPADILAAAQALAGVCDGARTRDEHGYNALDGPTAKSILRASSPTARQIRCLWNILKKYRKQLAGFGFEYDLLVPPELPPRESGSGKFTLPTNRVRLVWVDTKYGRQIAVVFAYDQAIVAAVKGQSGTKRWFDKEGSNSGGFKNCWIIPGDLDQVQDFLGRLEELAPPVTADVEPEIAEFMAKETERRKTNLAQSRAESAELEIPTKLPLYPFQKAGVKWISDHDGRALVADEMGVGKSAQALGWMMLHPEALPALVVCPSSIRITWLREVSKFTGLKASVMTAKSSLKSFLAQGIPASDKPLEGYDLTILNYDLFRAFETEESKKARATAKLDPSKPQPRKEFEHEIARLPMSEFSRFKTVVFDEFHKCKEPQAQRSRVAEELGKSAKNVIGLTGTPIMSRPIEIFHPMRIIRPKLFPNVIEYGKKFCNGFQDRFGWNLSGASNLEELDEALRTRGGMIRRLKSQVLAELPSKTRVTIPILLEGKMAEYKKASSPIIGKLAQQKAELEEWRIRMGTLSDEERKRYIAAHAEEAAAKHKLSSYMIDEIEKIKQAAVHAKFDEAMKFILDLHESKSKLIVFTTHHDTTDRITEKLVQEKICCESIDSRTSQADRDPIKDRFQEGDTEVLIGGIMAMSEGLTLTASDTVVFTEFSWTPASHLQAEARVHRISQKNAVTAYYLVALGTLEEKLCRMIDAKTEITYSALGEGDRMLNEKGIMDSILDELL